MEYLLAAGRSRVLSVLASTIAAIAAVVPISAKKSAQEPLILHRLTSKLASENGQVVPSLDSES